MTADGFEATFRLSIDRTVAWDRLTARPAEAGGDGVERLWLPGFDSTATVVDSDPPARLRATKDEPPCAGTDIVVTLTDEATGTRIHVVQSGFGDRLPARRDLMEIGWRLITADLHAFLATGAHPARRLRRWGDLGASATPGDGGVAIRDIRPDGLAARLGLADGDLLVALAGAPITSPAELDTVLRVVADGPDPSAEWIRGGQLHRA